MSMPDIKFDIVENLDDEQTKANELLKKFNHNSEHAFTCAEELEKQHFELLRYADGWMGGCTHNREVKKFWSTVKQKIKS